MTLQGNNYPGFFLCHQYDEELAQEWKALPAPEKFTRSLVKEFSLKKTIVSFFRNPTEEGICPASWFPLKAIMFIQAQFPSFDGISPLIMLQYRLNPEL